MVIRMDSTKSVVTLTFGDSAENHVGMEQIGTMVAPGDGYTIEDLVKLQQVLEVESELIDLDQEGTPLASVLILRKGVEFLFRNASTPYTALDLFEEQIGLNVDKHAYMYGRVVNKKARWNLCFDDESREPDYANGMGRIIGTRTLPLTSCLIHQIETTFGPKAKGLKGEGNYYYDIAKCGIGFHGDSERRKVIAVRLGASMPLHYQWFKDGTPFGHRMILPLHGGDMYIMSEKAVGTDWKKSSIYTLRHATGCEAFTTI